MSAARKKTGAVKSGRGNTKPGRSKKKKARLINPFKLLSCLSVLLLLVFTLMVLGYVVFFRTVQVHAASFTKKAVKQGQIIELNRLSCYKKTSNKA